MRPEPPHHFFRRALLKRMQNKTVWVDYDGQLYPFVSVSVPEEKNWVFFLSLLWQERNENGKKQQNQDEKILDPGNPQPYPGIWTVKRTKIRL